MKKYRVIIGLAFALVLFAGCKKPTQDEFSEALAEQSKMNAGNYSLVIDNVEIKGGDEADAPARASMEMAAKMINGTKISGEYLKDDEKELLEMSMNVELLGQKVPVKFFMDQKKKSLYMSTEMLSEISQIAKEFGSEAPINESDLQKLKGKYIHIEEKDLEDKGANKANTDVVSGGFNSKLFREYAETLDSDSFEKKDDTITRTFTKKDIQGFIKYAKENGNSDEKKTAKDLEKKLDDLTKYEQTVTIDTKKNTQKTTLKLAAKNNGTTVSADVKIENQAKNSDKSVTLPKKADTVSTEEVEKIFSTTKEESSLISDEDFNDLLEAIRSGQTQLTQTQIDQLKRTYKPYLTEEQYKQLEEALDQSMQMSA